MVKAFLDNEYEILWDENEKNSRTVELIKNRIYAVKLKDIKRFCYGECVGEKSKYVELYRSVPEIYDNVIEKCKHRNDVILVEYIGDSEHCENSLLLKEITTNMIIHIPTFAEYYNDMSAVVDSVEKHGNSALAVSYDAVHYIDEEMEKKYQQTASKLHETTDLLHMMNQQATKLLTVNLIRMMANQMIDEVLEEDTISDSKKLSKKMQYIKKAL